MKDIIFTYGVGIHSDLTCESFNYLKPRSLEGVNPDNVYVWSCECVCGNMIDVSARYLISGAVVSCGCISVESAKESLATSFGDITEVLWSSFEKNAKDRDVPFEVTIEHAWILFLKQDRRCALTGDSLVMFSSSSTVTASLCMIDTSLGYVYGNIQWVHRDVALLKGSAGNIWLKELCRLMFDEGRLCVSVVLTDPCGGYIIDNISFKETVPEWSSSLENKSYAHGTFVWFAKKISKYSDFGFNALKKESIALSGGFDCPHKGHYRMFKEAKAYGLVIAILNSDAWLMRKKGYVFMTFDERKEILESSKYIDVVIAVDDSDDSVCEALKGVRPDYFGNGGDRKSDNTPEVKLCNDLGVHLAWNMGGGKIQSSSDLVKDSLSKP